MKSGESNKVEEARRAVVESIDRGVPVQYGSEEDGLIVGYQKSGAEWLCLHPLRDGGKKTFVEAQWGWGIAVFTGRKTEVPSQQELARGALQQAVDMAQAGVAENYFVGFRAWEEYMARLKELESAVEHTRQTFMLGNAWIYGCLAQYRGCASRYLREVVGGFGGQTAEHLRKAAGLYETISKQVLTDAGHSAVAVAPSPGTLKDGQTWTAEMRQEQSRRLQAALASEREAVAEIALALAATGKTRPALCT